VLADLAARPDCVPALAALAATRPVETRIERVVALRGKESDRIVALAKALGALGVRCEELADGLVVRGPLPAREGTARCPVPDDHRVVMALALLGTILPDGIELEHGEAVAKSWPAFFEWLGKVAVVEW
jgi:3-phosphoshikimate 1-carboxyvinyltransferase